MDSETRDVLDDAAQAGPDDYAVAAGAELGQLVAANIARTGKPLDPDAVTFDSLLDVDYDDCAIGACAPTGVPAKGKRPEMTFWEARNLIAEAGEHGVPLKVNARTCTLIDRALQAAVKHSARTQHVMLVSYHYDTLPGPIGSTEVVVVDAEHVDQVNVRHDGLTGWTFIAPEPTITAAVADIRSRAVSEFRNQGDVEALGTWTNTALAEEIHKNRPETDAQVLRVLAARVANDDTNQDNRMTLADVAAALLSLTAAVAKLAGRELTDDDEPEAFTVYATTVDNLRYAAEGVAEMAGWV